MVLIPGLRNKPRHPFVAVLGPTAVAARLPDAVLGVLTVVLLYVWLRGQAGRTVALAAAAMSRRLQKQG